MNRQRQQFASFTPRAPPPPKSFLEKAAGAVGSSLKNYARHQLYNAPWGAIASNVADYVRPEPAYKNIGRRYASNLARNIASGKYSLRKPHTYALPLVQGLAGYLNEPKNPINRVVDTISNAASNAASNIGEYIPDMSNIFETEGEE